MTGAGPSDPIAVVRSKEYLKLLLLAAILGAPISAVAYGFLALVQHLQVWTFDDLPKELGFSAAPFWWPLPLLGLAGVLVGLIIRFLPGRGGESPAEGFKAGQTPSPAALPGIALAALASLALGAVIGPEGPLIAIGGGLGVLAVRLAKRDAPAPAMAMVAAAGSFAAISTLLGSPLLGAFLLMEAAGLGGLTMTLVLMPGLLAAGIGSLIFTGLGSWTGEGTFSLAIPDLPQFDRPNIAEFGWALVIGLAAAVAGWAIRRLALRLQPHVERRLLVLTPAAGLVVAGLAILYAQTTGKNTSDVLFSGQDGLPALISTSSSYSVGALLMLLACKGLAYSVSLSAFRGGPVFPAMYVGAAGGIALSHVAALPMVPGMAMGIGAMSAAMLKLPLTSVLLATLLLSTSGLAAMPLAIVAVVVSYVASTRLTPMTPGETGTAPQPRV